MSVMDEFTADAMSDAIDDVDGLRDGLLKMLREKGTGWTKRTLADFLAVQRWMRDGAPDEIVKMVVPTREEARAELEWAPRAPKKAKCFKKSFVAQLNAKNPDAHAKLWHELNVKEGRELTRDEFLDHCYLFLKRNTLEEKFGGALSAETEMILGEFVKERVRARKDE